LGDRPSGDDSCYPHILVSGVELCAEDGGGETETEVHIAGGNVPQHHVPVSGGAEELSATAAPAEADTHDQIESSSNNSSSKLTLTNSPFSY
jgi:hypothetical protein